MAEDSRPTRHQQRDSLQYRSLPAIILSDQQVHPPASAHLEALETAIVLDLDGRYHANSINPGSSNSIPAHSPSLKFSCTTADKPVVTRDATILGEVDCGPQSATG